MTKSERREADKLVGMVVAGGAVYVGYAARGLSALIRSTATTKNRNELITIAAGVPAIVQHRDFIVD